MRVSRTPRVQVISNHGLCVAIYDLVRVGEAHLHPGSAYQHISVEFRLAMFCPFVGEILSGTIVSCDEQGLRISMGFFDEIHVPSRLLQEPSFALRRDRTLLQGGCRSGFRACVRLCLWRHD